MIFSLPYPVPPVVEAEADALAKASIWTEGRLVKSIPYFILHVLRERSNGQLEYVYSSPLLTENQLVRHVYEFNTPLPVLKWLMRLDMYTTYRGKEYHLWKLFTIDTGTLDPRGSGQRVVVNGNGANARSARSDLRTKTSEAVKRDGSGTRGFSSPKEPRPNESENESYTERNWTKFGTGPWNDTGTSVKTYVRRSRVWTGTTTPGFGTTATKRLPVNPHTVSMRRTFDGPAVFAANNVANGNASGYMGIHTKHYPGATQPLHLAEASAKALQRLVGRQGDRQNIAETLATAGQTRDMVIGNVTRIVKSVLLLKKGNIPEAVKTLFRNHNPRYRRRGGPKPGKDLASNWLELQYGWKPLIDDVHWAMKALQEKNPEGLVVRTVGSAKAMSETKTNVLTFRGGGGVAGTKTIRTVTQAKYVIWWERSSQVKALLAQAGFTNPVSLAWELLPFSFVADWFLRIGPFLEQLSAFDGLTFMQGSKTQFTRQWTTFALNYQETSPFNVNQKNWETSYYHDEWITLGREKLTSFPSPVLNPPRNGLASATRVANAMALLRQVFK